MYVLTIEYRDGSSLKATVRWAEVLELLAPHNWTRVAIAYRPDLTP